MDVRQLRYFVEVVQAKSFTKAAERVRVAQPALGFQVRKLEEELGSKLLVRHSRGVRTTEAGDALLKHAHAILRQIELAKQEVIDLAGPPRGPLALGVTPTASASPRDAYRSAVQRRFPRYRAQSRRRAQRGRDASGWTRAASTSASPITRRRSRVSRPGRCLIEDLYYISPMDDGIDGAEKIALSQSSGTAH